MYYIRVTRYGKNSDYGYCGDFFDAMQALEDAGWDVFDEKSWALFSEQDGGITPHLTAEIKFTGNGEGIFLQPLSELPRKKRGRVSKE